MKCNVQSRRYQTTNGPRSVGSWMQVHGAAETDRPTCEYRSMSFYLWQLEIAQLAVGRAARSMGMGYCGGPSRCATPRTQLTN
ncbi:hypothetical protein J6590_060722 [Homalodisca vitripennis]|nr:hypothetical protein J6590_060722 [Homalodisca vitripennis]